MAGMHLPLRLNCEHFAGIIENRSYGVFLRASPFRIAERTESRRPFADADVTRNQISLFERDVQFCFIGKLKNQDLLCRPGYFVRRAELQRTPGSQSSLLQKRNERRSYETSFGAERCDGICFGGAERG